jgi:tetratricopeptide (TPR) repeat protein
MAEIYDLQGNHERALDKYEEVAQMLDLDAKSGHAVDLELCKLYTKAGKMDLALKHGLIEYKKRPRNIDVNHAMAVVAFKSNDFKKAKEYISVAMSTGSKDPELLNDASKIDRSLANAQFGYEPIVVANR